MIHILMKHVVDQFYQIISMGLLFAILAFGASIFILLLVIAIPVIALRYMFSTSLNNTNNEGI